MGGRGERASAEGARLAGTIGRERTGPAKRTSGHVRAIRVGYHGRTSGFADLDSAGLADSPSTSILLWAACGVSTSMAEAIARATAERSSLSGGAGVFCRAVSVRA